MPALTTMTISRPEHVDVRAHYFPQISGSAEFVAVTFDWSDNIETKVFFSSIEDAERLAKQFTTTIAKLRKDYDAIALQPVQ